MDPLPKINKSLDQTLHSSSFTDLDSPTTLMSEDARPVLPESPPPKTVTPPSTTSPGVNQGKMGESKILSESGCEEACPFDMICEYVIQKKYDEANALCKKILIYEPENQIVQEFQRLTFKEEVSATDEESSSSEDEDDNVTSSSSDDGEDARDSTYSTGEEEEDEGEDDVPGSSGGDNNVAALEETGAEIDALTDAYMKSLMEKFTHGGGDGKVDDTLSRFFSISNEDSDEESSTSSSSTLSSSSSNSSSEESGESTTDSEDESESSSEERESEDHDSGISNKGFSSS